MQKIFSLFAALLFAGSIMAVEVQIYKNEGVAGSADGITATGNVNTNTSNGNPGTSFANTTASNTTFTFEGFAVSAYSNLRLALDAKFASFPKNTDTWPYLEVKFYKNNSVVQTDATTVAWSEKGNNYSTYSINITNDFDKIEMIGHPAEGTTGSGNPATNYAIYFDNVTLYGESSEAVITADDINLGEVMYEPGGQYEHEVSIDVQGANLTDDISFSSTSSKLSFLTFTDLGPAGGSILVLINATEGALNEQILLQSGSTQKTVNITGAVFEKLYNPGTGDTDATLVTPAEADTAYLVDNTDVPFTVNGDQAIKVGTSAKLGKAKIQVPANAKTLYVMLAAWANKPCNITVTAPTGVTVASDSINAQGKVHLYADAGLTGNGPAYETAKGDLSLYQYEFSLSGLSGATVIEFASTARSSARFFVWNATYSTVDTTPIDKTQVTTETVKFFENGQLFIIRDGKTYNVQGQQVR